VLRSRPSSGGADFAPWMSRGASGTVRDLAPLPNVSVSFGIWICVQTDGLAKGGSLRERLGRRRGRRPINGPLHFPDELVRHKILDLLGVTSFLLGKPLLGHDHRQGAGHQLHLQRVVAPDPGSTRGRARATQPLRRGGRAVGVSDASGRPTGASRRVLPDSL